MNKLTRLTLAVGALAALLLSGCPPTEKAYSVKGKIQDSGSPLKVTVTDLPPGVQGLEVAFRAMKDNVVGEAHAAVVNDDGSFTVPGPSGKGIPAGKYRITVLVAASNKPVTPAGAPGGAPGGGGGVPPGTGVPPGGGAAAPPPNEGTISGLPDKFKGAYGADKSPLTIDIDGPVSLLIEVGKTSKVSKE